MMRKARGEPARIDDHGRPGPSEILESRSARASAYVQIKVGEGAGTVGKTAGAVFHNVRLEV